MKLWTIWVRSYDGQTWLEAAWDDDSTAENQSGYGAAVKAAEKVAEANNGQMRVVCIEVPGTAIFGAFDVPTVKGAVVDA